MNRVKKEKKKILKILFSHEYSFKVCGRDSSSFFIFIRFIFTALDILLRCIIIFFFLYDGIIQSCKGVRRHLNDPLRRLLIGRLLHL
jgi:hypothetical protein